ncbi:MAG: hypothetical protein HC895_19695 [Leptolyngbyaceae cyanobacterium SM1_3_5]|nr:hypothetical protein [Leptolyngbyaceae cyanobacterium SM1_3_5]
MILATIQVQSCQLLKDVSIAERRDAVPAQQPYIAAGQTEPGKTEWQLFPNKDSPIGVRAIVSTNSAGFRTPPRYQAHIVGDRLVSDTVNEQSRQFVVDGYAQVAGASATQFEMQVILPSGTTVGSGLSDEVTSEDFQAVVRVIAERIGGIDADIATFILQTLRGRISVGQRVSSGNIIPEDFDHFLSTIATRLSTSIDQLLADNQLTRQTLTLAIGDRLINPSAILLLNPLDIVFEEDFLAKLKTPLNWHVVWMGIEG